MAKDINWQFIEEITKNGQDLYMVKIYIIWHSTSL